MGSSRATGTFNIVHPLCQHRCQSTPAAREVAGKRWRRERGVDGELACRPRAVPGPGLRNIATSSHHWVTPCALAASPHVPHFCPALSPLRRATDRAASGTASWAARVPGRGHVSSACFRRVAAFPHRSLTPAPTSTAAPTRSRLRVESTAPACPRLDRQGSPRQKTSWSQPVALTDPRFSQAATRVRCRDRAQWVPHGRVW